MAWSAISDLRSIGFWIFYPNNIAGLGAASGTTSSGYPLVCKGDPCYTRPGQEVFDLRGREFLWALRHRFFAIYFVNPCYRILVRYLLPGTSMWDI